MALKQRRERYREAVIGCVAEQRHATRHGKETKAKRSMGEVAKILGVSRQAVHQVERTALLKIRIALLDELAEQNPELALEIITKARRMGLVE